MICRNVRQPGIRAKQSRRNGYSRATRVGDLQIRHAVLVPRLQKGLAERGRSSAALDLRLDFIYESHIVCNVPLPLVQRELAPGGEERREPEEGRDALHKIFSGDAAVPETNQGLRKLNLRLEYVLDRGEDVRGNAVLNDNVVREDVVDATAIYFEGWARQLRHVFLS